MNEPQLPLGPVRSQLVRHTSWVGFLATTIALMLLASGGTAYLVNIGTEPRAVPRGGPLSIGTPEPLLLRPTSPVVVQRELGAVAKAAVRTVSQPSVLAPAVERPRAPRAPAVPRPVAPPAPPVETPPVDAPPVEVPPAPPAPVLPEEPPVADPLPTPPGNPVKDVLPLLPDTVKGVLGALSPKPKSRRR